MFMFRDFEVEPLHVPASSPKRPAQTPHTEQTQNGALIHTSSCGLLEMSHLQTNSMMPADQGLLTRQSRRTTTLTHAMFSWDRASQ
jgi:hypothetical protein